MLGFLRIIFGFAIMANRFGLIVVIGHLNDNSVGMANNDFVKCQLSPITLMIEHEGCVPKPISSFACVGQCLSGVEISGNGEWQLERSCNCCQEFGELETEVVLYCPESKDQFKQMKAKTPMNCMCRTCLTAEEESSIVAHELIAFKDQDSLPNFHYKV